MWFQVEYSSSIIKWILNQLTQNEAGGTLCIPFCRRWAQKYVDHQLWVLWWKTLHAVRIRCWVPEEPATSSASTDSHIASLASAESTKATRKCNSQRVIHSHNMLFSSLSSDQPSQVIYWHSILQAFDWTAFQQHVNLTLNSWFFETTFADISAQPISLWTPSKSLL